MEDVEPIVEGEVDELAVVEETEEAAPSEEIAETEVSEKPDQSTPEKDKKGVQKRIDELTRQRYEAEEARKELEQRLSQYEAQLNQVQTQHIQGQWEQYEPKIEDYDYDQAKWKQAYNSWLGEGLQRQQQAQAQAQQARKAQEDGLKKQIEMQRKMSEAQAKYPDFMLKVNNPELPSIANLNQAAYEALIDSDAMADISYYLASNPSEVYRFKDLTPIRAVKEIAKLEAKLSARPTNSITNAPEPPTKQVGKSTPAENPAKMTTAEWMEWRRKQIKSR